MATAYLQGGDAYQILDYPKLAGQTFRVDSAFTLQWLDLNLKLMGRTPEVLIEIYLAGVDHLPHGDPISSSRYWLINQPLPTRDWLWLEPWGKTLNENHYWLPQPVLDPPDITIKNGNITLINTGLSAQWIDTLLSTTPFPLVDPNGDHLHFHHHSPISYGGEFYHWHSYTFKLEKGVELWTLEAIISNGLHWPPLNGDCGITPLGSCFFEGHGPGVFDLTEKWIHCRTFHGKDPDPAGWTLSHLQHRIESVVAHSGGTLQNNFCGLARQQYTPVPYDDYNVLPPKYTWPNRLYRVRFSMKSVDLSPDFYYFMKVTAFVSLGENAHYWQYDKDDSTYPSGIRLSSDNAGVDWTIHVDDDHLFAAFGTPPAPTPPPDPPLPNWVILLVEQILTPTGYKIKVWTNVPCHLYMFWTDTEPQKHMRTKRIRGLDVLDTPAFCFVTWHQNEQEESGDTILHTFIKEPWPVCETRWFCFRALVNNEWSPSVAPIFKKHRKELIYGDCVWIDCPYIDTANFLQGEDNTWSGAKVNYNGYSICPHVPSAQALFTGSKYYCSRTSFAFDTSLIPADAKILSANIRLYDATSFSHLPGHGDYYVYLVDGNQWNEDCASHWFSKWHSWQDVCAYYHIPANKAYSCKLYPITDLGLTRIVGGGHTKYVVKLHYDYEEVPPTDMSDYYLVQPAAFGCAALLQVQYCPLLQPPL